MGIINGIVNASNILNGANQIAKIYNGSNIIWENWVLQIGTYWLKENYSDSLPGTSYHTTYDEVSLPADFKPRVCNLNATLKHYDATSLNCIIRIEYYLNDVWVTKASKSVLVGGEYPDEVTADVSYTSDNEEPTKIRSSITTKNGFYDADLYLSEWYAKGA